MHTMSDNNRPESESSTMEQGSNSAWVEIDLSKLDQTGEKYDIYMLGYACSSGQILRQDSTGKIILGKPLPADLTLPSSQFTASGDRVTLSTSANLFVGGEVEYPDGHSTSKTTITSIEAHIVCANQPHANGPFAPYTNPGWTTGANTVLLGPASVNQGTVTNETSGSQVTNLPSAAGTASGIGLGSLVNGYFPPSGSEPTAKAKVSGGSVTGFSKLQAGGRYQYAPTVTFPGSGVKKVATGTCTLDTNGQVNGVTITTAGSGYEKNKTYPAVFSTPPGNTYFFPSDQNGFPGPTSTDAAAVTSIGIDGENMTFDLSQKTDQPSWAKQSPFDLAPAAINVYSGGTNASGCATLQHVGNTKELTKPNVSIADLPSTVAVQGYDVLLDSAGSSLVVEGVAGSAMIYAVTGYTFTLADPIPADTTSLTFRNSVNGQVDTTGRKLTISADTYSGIASALALGQSPTITFSGKSVSNLSIHSLSQSKGTITVELSGALSATFQGQQVKIALPPSGGTLPAIKWNKTTNNAVWAEQLPGDKGAMSVNGARIYFILDTLGIGAPSFNYSIGLDASQNEVVTVTQPPDAIVWQGKVSPFQYIELTLDALPQTGGGGGDGLVYIDLSAVDGFFFPAALSTTVNKQSLLMGQPWQSYTAPNTTGPNTYAAVTREEILTAWQTFFGSTSKNFATDSSSQALCEAYAGLLVQAQGRTIGIQNPTFAYASPDTSISAFDACWDDALNALFKSSNEIDLTGDLPIGGKPSYYKGTQVTVTDSNGKSCNAIKFDEYKKDYKKHATTGASFWVFDPRTPPVTEGQAYVSANHPMSVGYQVFANTGVFASTALVQGGDSPNYTPGSSAWTSKEALKQLLALQRDIVTALNRGVGALGIGIVGGNKPGAGATTTYWNTETNWYPFSAPYTSKTPQNLFSQWVHTTVIDKKSNKYYATYPFDTAGYGTPTKSAGTDTPLMNQTYGFGYDETPNNAANVPAKFLPIPNKSGGTITFDLAFGPWKKQ